MKKFTIKYLTVSEYNLAIIERKTTVRAASELYAINFLKKNDVGFIKVLEITCNV